MACSCVAGVSDIVSEVVANVMADIMPVRVPGRRGRPPKWPKYSQTHAVNRAPNTVSSLPQTSGTNSMLNSSSPRTGNQAPKTVIKGNIIYKRTESGEVVASVLKNEPNMVFGEPSSVTTSRVRGSTDVRSSASLFVADDASLTADSPVNENNVEQILNESIAATQSMRRMLVSLKDDLRRMGGGPVMSPNLKPVHLQHRINIAYKLSRAFADYRRTVGFVSSGRLPVSNQSGSRRAVTATRPASSTVTAVSTACRTVAPPQPVMCHQPVKSTHVPASTSHFVSIASSPSVPCSSRSTISVAESASRPKTVSARAAETTVTKQTPTTPTDLMHLVSNDLWMLCEQD